MRKVRRVNVGKRRSRNQLMALISQKVADGLIIRFVEFIYRKIIGEIENQPSLCGEIENGLW